MSQPNQYFLNSNPACPPTLQYGKKKKRMKAITTLFPIQFALRPQGMLDNLVDIILAWAINSLVLLSVIIK